MDTATATTPGIIPPTKPVWIDLGCGKNKKAGFIGVDVRPFEGVDVVMDAGKDRWPWNDGTVDEIYASHFLEHLGPEERIHCVNEAHRVLKQGGKFLTITPYSDERAYGDFTHKAPKVVAFWFNYLNAAWRAVNAPHEDRYTCDFDYGYGFSLINDPRIVARNDEFKMFAVAYYQNVAQDMTATLTKR